MSEEECKSVGLGIGKYKVPLSMYRNNRNKLFDRFAALPSSAFKHAGKGALFLQGGQLPLVAHRVLVVYV